MKISKTNHDVSGNNVTAKIATKFSLSRLNFIIFLIISAFSTSQLLAQNSADIVCVDSLDQHSFQINTQTQQVWYNQSTVISGAVFSGIYSPKNFVGEILAETTLNNTSYYITLIMRNTNGNPQLEALWYPKQNANQSIRMILNDCFLQLN